VTVVVPKVLRRTLRNDAVRNGLNKSGVKKRRRIEFSPGVPSEAGVTYKLSVA
jgi:hypothetical protein